MDVERRFNELCEDHRWQPHVRRYVETWRALTEHCGVRSDRAMTVVECGGGSPFTAFLREQALAVFPTGEHVDLALLNGDQPLPFTQPNSADLVLCMEVMEHLKDDAEPRDMWTGDSVVRMLSACARTMRPDAWLLLSTPNASSWITFWRWVHGEHPFQFHPHVREFTLDDVGKLLWRAGLAADRAWTSDVWCRHGMPDRVARAVKRVLDETCGEVSKVPSRGDCLFVLARRRM